VNMTESGGIAVRCPESGGYVSGSMTGWADFCPFPPGLT